MTRKCFRPVVDDSARQVPSYDEWATMSLKPPDVFGG